MKCPKCQATISNRIIAAQLGSKGGSVTGPSKARTSEQARAAARKRWANHVPKDFAK